MASVVDDLNQLLPMLAALDHVVAVVVPDSEPLPSWVESDCLSESELARRERTTHPRAKFQFERGRLILRNALGRWMGVAPKDVPIRLCADGKPMLDSPYESFHFNVSNTEGFIAIAFSKMPVGIDLERHRPGRDLPGLVKRYFAPNEAKQFESLPTQLREAAFLRGWTCKEALLKGLGCGVRELANCEVELDPRLPPSAKKLPRDAGEWELHCWTVSEAVEAAVALLLVSLEPRPQGSVSEKKATLPCGRGSKENPDPRLDQLTSHPSAGLSGPSASSSRSRGT